MNGTIAYVLNKKYTKETVDGAGAIAGKPCTIKSIEDIEGGHRVTFAWVDNSDIEYTDYMDVMNGEKGEKGDKGDKGAPGGTGTIGEYDPDDEEIILT